MKHTMLHMKLNSAVSVFAVAAAFSVLLPTSAYCGICFLPDCGDDKLAGGGDINMNINEDSEYCEKKGYTYYLSGQCPQYQAKVGTCSRDDYYLKCDAQTWCKQNGYDITSCSIPQYFSEQCPNGEELYKSCQTDNARACTELGYTNTCPSGQKLKNTSGRCAYDSSYGTCCTPSDCPAYTSLTSSSYGTNGTDGCEYTCYYTCDPNCPSGTSTSNPGGCGGSTTNGCGNVTCYYPYVSCCTYTITASYCSSQCKYTSSSSCVKNGTTYYSGCGSSKCSSIQTCNNGTCQSNVATSGYCCDFTGNYCSYYTPCRSKTGYPDCSDMMSSCEASGGSPVFQYCHTLVNGYFYVAEFNCQ